MGCAVSSVGRLGIDGEMDTVGGTSGLRQGTDGEVDTVGGTSGLCQGTDGEWTP